MKVLVFCLLLYLCYLIAKVFINLRKTIGRTAYDWLANEKLPAELKSAVIYMNETEIIDRDGGKGRVDQVFLTADKRLIIVDSKTRNQHRVYQSDIDQVSRYALALNKSEPYLISAYCYIRTVIIRAASKSVYYHRVRIKTTAALRKKASLNDKWSL